MNRGPYGEIPSSSYPTFARALIAGAEKAGAWQTGIESNKRGRGESINVDLYSFDEARGLVLVQVRQCRFGRRFDQVRKDYYLIGTNENGNTFAHPVDVRASGRVVSDDPAAGVRLALSRIWNCREKDLDCIARNGDVAFVYVGTLPTDAIPCEINAITIRESHHVQSLADGKIYRTPDGTYYVAGKAKIEHGPGQHPTARVRGGVWRVQEGIRAKVWGFSAPTKD
jgi:hypothetical protein